MKHDPKLGQWYVDTTNGRVYVVAHVADKYILVNINTGIPYGSGCTRMRDVFMGDDADFKATT